MNAQTWCPPGAIWSYTMISSIGGLSQPISGVINDQYRSDTVINSKVCKHIVGAFKGKLSGGSPVTLIGSYRESYTYENNKVLYVWAYSPFDNVNTFDTVVNFKAAIGDKWLKNRWKGTCNSHRPVTVTDTGHVIINSQSLKRIVTSYSAAYSYASNTYTFLVIDTLIEKIMHPSKFMIPEYCEIDNATDGGVYNGEFLCYKDSLFPNYQRPGTASCGYIADGLNERVNNNFPGRIYPNPTSAQLLIESELFNPSELYGIVITNLLGQCVARLELKILSNHISLDLSALDKGIYCLQLRDKSGLLANEKIIKD